MNATKPANTDQYRDLTPTEAADERHVVLLAANLCRMVLLRFGTEAFYVGMLKFMEQVKL